MAGDKAYPDQGFLSDTRYANQYFDFGFDFPPDIHWQPVHRPVAPDGHVQLLELEGPSPQHAIISITAYLRRDKDDPNAKQMLRKELDNELFYGVEELHGLSKATIDQHQFYFYETRRGIDQHYFLATDLNGYVLHVALAGRDDKLVGRLHAAFVATRFFDPGQVQQFAGTGAKPYDGPAMSSHRLASLKSDSPAKRLDPGTIVDDQYRNRELGLTYTLPQGWKLGTQPAVAREVERARQLGGDGPSMGPAEAELVQACEKVLFSAWKEPAGSNGMVAYDSFGEVTLSAMSLACFPDLKVPSDVSNASDIKAFLGQFGLTHPLMRDTRQGRAFESSGQLFLLTEGVVAFQVPGDALLRRLSIAMLITQQRGYLLTWFFAAPHQSELRELMSASFTLDREPARNLAEREVTDGGGAPAATSESPSSSGTASPSGASSTAGNGSAGSSATLPSSNPNQGSASSAQAANSSPATNPPTQANGTQASSSASGTQESSASNTQPSQRPSLLRPGETMSDQQMSGTPVPKKH